MNDYYEEDEGLHFDPTGPEVINSYLIPMLRGEPMEDFIVVKDVYAKEPWLLDHTNHPFLKEDEWYYVSRNTQISKEKVGCGKYSKRKIIGDGIDRGNWNANGKEDIIDEETGKVIGIKQNFTYHSAIKNKNKKQKRGDGGSVSIDVPSNESWIMDEFRLPTDTFQDTVLCKIHKKKWSEKKKEKEKENDHHVEDKLDQELVVPRKIHKKRNSKKKKEKDHHEEASTSTNHDQHDDESSSSSSFWEQQKKEALGGEKVDEQVEAMENERFEDWIEELLLGSDQDLLSIP
ncbi:PREDICTED: NAC domain-containing protein 35-like [Camelina sativa]|uniref:NAC domain-containing protein 35-like n=1 Tax=Camelina sativa TaxID=90675 RepID=A0ABM0XFH8_CAMSA|nr:PREDICTED: NAC domain-containing protein 35-like [Camelina sativa]